MINLFENVINEDVIDNMNEQTLKMILAMFGDDDEQIPMPCLQCYFR